MKKRLAFLLIAALLLSCLSGTALALDVGDECPYCQIGTLSSTITFAYNWGHMIYAKCSNYQCGMDVLINQENHDLTGLTCWNGAKCPICHWDYLNPDNHEDFCKLKWITTATTHKQVWSACYKVEVAETAHNWSNGVCLDCDYVCEHDWSDKNGVCKICKLPCTNLPEGATCTTAAQCSVCSASHLNPNVHDDSCTLQWVSTSATTHKGVWSGCKLEVPEAAHRWGVGQCKDCGYVCTHGDGKNEKIWVSEGIHVHYLTWSCCGWYADDTPYVHRWVDGKCADCNEPCLHIWENGVCVICKMNCAHDWADGVCTICESTCAHDKTAVDAAVAATCTAKGLTKGEHCEICGKVLKAQQSVKALGHRYGEWTDNGDGTHSATCLRDGCGYVNTVECVRYELMVDEGLVDICPISGEFGDAQFQIIEDAACEPIDEIPLPEGELLVRGLELPMGETAVAIGELDEAVVPMYGFTFVFASNGQIVDLNAAVRLRVPMELDGGFRLVRLNVQTDAEERWTELAYVYADGVLDFETDAAGLFLLLPLEEA